MRLLWLPCVLALSPSAPPRARLDRRAFNAALAGLASLAPAAPAAARDPIISNCRKAKPGEADALREGQVLRSRGKVICDATDTAADAPPPAVARAPRTFGTDTGIVYYDVGRFDDPSARTPLRARSRVLLDYALRRDGFDAEPGGAGAPGAPAFSTLEFILGDGLENDAVDELVRSMVPGTPRRATVPAAFGLGGGAPGAPSYLELNVRAVLGKGEYREEERAAQRCDEGAPLPVLCKPPR